MPSNTAITLMYRDARNYKSRDIRLVLRGKITDREITLLNAKLEDGMLIARQIGLPTPSLGAFDEDDDHVFTTWVEMQEGFTANQMHTDDPAMFLIDIHCLVWRICAVQHWDVAAELDIRLSGAFEHLVCAAEYARDAMCETEGSAT
ncbi:MAG: hypothetical protein OEL20_05210 [Sulfuritalea sp.]|nr:hypothetical protein [Sulfuritalea sp.]